MPTKKPITMENASPWFWIIIPFFLIIYYFIYILAFLQKLWKWLVDRRGFVQQFKTDVDIIGWRDTHARPYECRMPNPIFILYFVLALSSFFLIYKCFLDIFAWHLHLSLFHLSFFFSVQCIINKSSLPFLFCTFMACF